MAWYAPLNPTTSKVRVSLRKLSDVPNQTGRSICPRGCTRLPGATPWNDVVLGCSWSNPIPISRRVCAYKMLMLLPSSISTLENRELPMTGSTTSGTGLGWGCGSGDPRD
jgi:hypothetical protein